MKKFTSRQIITFFSGILGFLIGILPFIIGFLGGTGIEFTKARNTNEFARYLQPQAAILFWILTSVLLCIFGALGYSYIRYTKIISSDNNKSSHIPRIFFYIRIVASLGVGYVLYELVVYLLINGIYYHNAFIAIPYLIGTGIFAGMIFIIMTDIDFLSFLKNMAQNLKARFQKSNPEPSLDLRKPINYLKLIKNLGVLIVGLIVLIPTLIPMAGFAPSPPVQPSEGFGSADRPYEVSIIRIENILPPDIASYVLPDNDNASWYSYLYLPNLASDALETEVQVPIAFFLHGYGGSFYKEYDRSLRTLASRGVATIFVQYTTDLNVDTILANMPNATLTNGADYYVRYNMTWNGMQQAINALTGNSSVIPQADLSAILGENYHIDLSRIMVMGHSYGGGMTLFMGPQILNQGWASKELIFDLEAPWYTTTWTPHQPDLSLLPNYTIVNVVGYEDDATASPCIGMSHFERFLSRDDSTPLSSQQVSYLYIQSDRYGFPRLVATHYLPTDALINTLTTFGYFRRIDAMAGYLVAKSMNFTTNSLEALTYFTQGGPNMVNLGNWSDGVPIKPILFSVDPYGIRGGTNLATMVLDPNHPQC